MKILMSDYELIIIGGGPGGVAAGVYAARKQLKTLFLTKDFGGQSIVSSDIQNWIGTVSIPGTEFAQALEKHLRAYARDVVEVRTGEWINKIEKTKDGFSVTTDKATYAAKTVLVATGSARRKLSVTGADTFENKGVTYCASCDGPLFSGQDVVVIGGGNAGFETAAQLLAYTKSVTLLENAPQFKADPITVEKVVSHPNMKAYSGVTIKEIKGQTLVTAIVFEKDGKSIELPTGGIFVEIGLIPTTSFVKELVELNKHNQIVIDPRTQQTSTPGVWAAGDCTDGLYHQNNIAAGDAVRALEDIYLHLRAK
ncbi:MAG: FAD-dependent oxidoreductase [Patescibacteria group bacterium]|nr:FAD-dependent oxidoreductase [bacterium]MDZ4240515.1 FAD-dependent oxidoreductase [Patescibacteria group bacterium]